MDPHAGSIVINGATSQYDRWLVALDAGYAPVDGRSFAELLDFAVKFARLVNFYDLKNEIDGDWVEFFLTDPTMILAVIEATDLPATQSDFNRLERLTSDAQSFDLKFQYLRDTFESILRLARLVDQWLQNLNRSPLGETARLLRQYLVSEIGNGLNEQLRLLISYDWGAGLPDALGRAIGLNYEGFSSAWNLGNICADGSIYRGRNYKRKINNALPPLTPIFFSFLDSISDLSVFATAHLDATLTDDNHKPHIALYIAFVRLFHTAQDTINRFSSRYINFYYYDILRERERGAIPDHVYLTFTLAEGVLHQSVPLQTLFSAGQDANGQDILYASDKNLTVTAALIQSVRTLRVLRGALLPEGRDATWASPIASPPSNINVMRRVLASEIAVDPATGTISPVTHQDWTTFGETTVGTKGDEVTKPATFGFAIASSYLLLTGGTRTVSLTIHYPEKFQDETLDVLLGELSAATGLSIPTIFRKVLKGAFTLYVSTAAGWLQVETYSVAVQFAAGADKPSFSIAFQLPPTFPAVVAYDADAAAGAKDAAAAPPATGDTDVNSADPAPSLPTLKLYLRQEPVSMSGSDGTVDVYPLSLLDRMPVTEFQIHADVINLAPVTIENTDGEVDAKQPFPVFGGLPVVGSYLLIRHTELFVKTLYGLQVGITWFNLPQNDDGFKGYYKDYVIGLDGKPACNLFNNSVFHGGLSIQNPGTWSLSNCYQSPYVPPEDVDVLLFRTEPGCTDTLPAGKLCSQTDFNGLSVFPCALPPYYDPAGSAIKLQLTEPPYAFGSDLFAPNVLNAVMEALPDSKLCQERCLDEYQVLKDAAQCIQTCQQCLGAFELASLSGGETSPPRGETSPPSDEIGLTGWETCIIGCLECLFKLAVECLQQCLAESKGLPAEEALLRLNRQMELHTKRTEEMWRSLLEQCREEHSKLSGAYMPACLRRCLDKFLKLLEAMLCIVECVWSTQPTLSSQGSLSDCLTNCIKELDTAYTDGLQGCMDDCMALKKEINYPNTPYLPQATGLTVNYSSRVTIPTTGNKDTGNQFFHLLPFGGYRRVELYGETEPPLLLPDFPYEGNLYIGFTGLVAPQTLTLLFDLAAGSDPDQAAAPIPVYWEYLSGNQWMPAKIQRDSTNGLQNTGVIALSLSTIASSQGTVPPPDYQWLRASVKEQPGMFPNTMGIYPNVVAATWQGSGAGEYLGKPLPPQTIKSSVQQLPGIATIGQPLESFGGSPPETEHTFKIRVGERLRHKQRAILDWDYERMVLERFPTIWKVQALPARSVKQGDAPGNVLVVVVAGQDSIGVVDPTVPQATADMLSQIHTYLKSYISPFIQLHVVNPIYVRLKVITKVQFRDDDDPGASIERLNQDLVQYLSPWFYDAARAAKGGRYASEDDISEFVQTRPYVEAMLSIKIEPDPATIKLDWYFLTSAKQHTILDAGAVNGYGLIGYR
jgi:hypothetical protein